MNGEREATGSASNDFLVYFSCYLRQVSCMDDLQDWHLHMHSYVEGDVIQNH